MILSRFGREPLRLTITTDPPLTNWEASFDRGVTWVDGVDDDADDTYTWLLAGPELDPDVPPADATELPVGNHPVLIRAVDNPLVIVRPGNAVSVR